MRHARLGLLAALAAVSIAGCDSDDSSNDLPLGKTSDVNFDVSIEATDDVTAKFSATFYIPGAGGPIRRRYFVLNAGDALSACVGAVCKAMTREGRTESYVADLPYVGETAYTISLSRQNDVSAPNTVITLPVPFTILAPPAGLSVTDGQQVTVQWSPPNNGDAFVRGNARCDHQGGIQSERARSFADIRPDTGRAIVSVDENFAGSVFRPFPPPQAPVLRCDVVLEVRQPRVGTIDPAFKNGGISAGITRSVMIEYTPSQR